MTTTDVLLATMFAVATATVGVISEAPVAAPLCEASVQEAALVPAPAPLCSPDEAVVHSTWDAFAD
ncbi:MAG: hypothetical protein KDM81_00425 [Verrucomicrobiae bacterium]|nr:hypothetical protein [Verrucomicrobiae bacterium]MCP5523830.1 hypothetical protein [Verrucomicrobiales bacterium]